MDPTHIPQIKITTNRHAEMVLEWWKLSGEYSMQIISSYLKKEIDAETLANLVAILRRVLLELIPKAREISDKEVQDKIKKYSQIIFQPDLIFKTPELLFEIEMFVRDLLEVTGYTNYVQYVEK